MQAKGVARGVDDHAAVDDAQLAVHAQAQALQHRSEMPGIDRLAVDDGLSAHRLEAGAVEEGRPQRVAGQRLVEAREAGGGAFERCRTPLAMSVRGKRFQWLGPLQISPNSPLSRFSIRRKVRLALQREARCRRRFERRSRCSMRGRAGRCCPCWTPRRFCFVRSRRPVMPLARSVSKGPLPRMAHRRGSRRRSALGVTLP